MINESNKIPGFLGIFEQTETLRSYELSTTSTSSKKKIKRGAKFLPDVSLEDLKAMQGKESCHKTRMRLQASIHRKRGLSLDAISDAIGYARSTVYGWLMRLAVGGIECRHDCKSPGRPCRLSERDRIHLDGILRASPKKSGFGSDMWTARMVASHIGNAFGIKYCVSGVLRLTDRMNFSVRKRRPVPYNTATKEELEKYVADTAKKIATHHSNGYKLFCFDAASIINTPVPKYGILPRGERDTVPVNYSKKGVHVIGAMGQDTVELDYPENLKAEGIIAFFKRLCEKHEKIFVILDNAGAHTGRAMKDYVKSQKGRVVLCFLPPRTPQHNPIEMLWRELKRAISNTFFNGSDEMKKRITLLVKSGDVPRIKLLWYMLEACGIVVKTRTAVLPAPEPPLNCAAVAPPEVKTRLQCHTGPPNRAAVAC